MCIINRIISRNENTDCNNTIRILKVFILELFEKGGINMIIIRISS